jgi:hypothetical protein
MKNDMKGQKLFYIFKDPMGSGDSKIGITGDPESRLGNYQNSYSKKSHTACFDVVYVGPARAIDNLENAVKQEFEWDIELDGRGHSEWVNVNYLAIESEVDQIIDGYRFKVTKTPRKYLPLTVDNLDYFLTSM